MTVPCHICGYHPGSSICSACHPPPQCYTAVPDEDDIFATLSLHTVKDELSRIRQRWEPDGDASMVTQPHKDAKDVSDLLDIVQTLIRECGRQMQYHRRAESAYRLVLEMAVAEGMWGGEDERKADAILLYLGRSTADSFEPGSDTTREKVAAIIAASKPLR